ncbi:cytochrome P450 [Thozetella sp. PMI_491]|nr:cytochrome P450 [Thozetella sp. PMI_491]
MLFANIDTSPVGLGVLATTGLFTWYLIWTFHSWWRLRHIPGPWFAGFSYIWIARMAGSGKQAYQYRDFGARYGPLVRVGPNYLTTDDPDLLRRMSGARNAYDRNAWYTGARWNPFHDNMFTLTNTAAHDTIKAKTAGGYSGRDTPTLERDIDSQIASLIRLIREKYLSSGSKVRRLDFAQIVSYFTLDAISLVAFGKSFGYLEADADLFDFLAIVRANWFKVSVSNDVPWIRSVLYSPYFLRLIAPKYTDTNGLGKIMCFARDAVARRYAEDDNGRKDMMHSWKRHGMTQTESESEGLFLILAGSDTTASVIRITLLNLLSNPVQYQKLKQTIATAVRDGVVSSPIAHEEARKIPYLQALVYEGIRIRAPATGPFFKQVPPEGDTIHGMYVPGGTAIGMNISSLFRSKKLFGEDADVFRPERFLEASDEHRIEMERNVELAFGYGRWMCAGKPIAFLELNKLFFELFRAFDFQLMNPTQPWESLSYMIFIEQNMWVKVTEASTV